MQNYQKNHYKERTPEETTVLIQRKLADLGIELEEENVPDSSADTCSLRVNIRGTGLGSNGKGINRAYARASAYAEFMERLQNDILTPFPRYPRHEKGFYSFPDEQFFTAAQVAALDNSFMEYFFRVRNMQTAQPGEKAAYLRKNQKQDFFTQGVPDEYEVRPFYSVSRKRVEYLPYHIYMPYYNSNGMSAGNTPEEALVQGLSEIIERHVQEKIYLEKPALPDIPDVYIRRFPYIWERVEKIRSLPGIRMFMKDCSFGGKYPVAAMILIDEDTGNYGVKLGCHPDYVIAMERTITEAAQGGDYMDYARRSILDFCNRNVDSVRNIYNSFKYGLAPFPYEIFGRESSWVFSEPEDVSACGNREILKRMLKGFTDAGYDVLIRDVSYTGFPSYHIIIPGISEINREHSLLFTRMLNTKLYLVPYLNSPQNLDVKTVKLLRAELDYWGDAQIECKVKFHYCAYPDFDFPGEEMGVGWLYMAAMCEVFLGDYRAAADRMQYVVQAADAGGGSKKAFYKAVFHYLTARGQNISHDRTMELLRIFFRADICEKAETIFRDPTAVFVSQYPEFPDWQNAEGADCEYRRYLQIRLRIREYMLAHPVNQEELGKLLF